MRAVYFLIAIAIAIAVISQVMPFLRYDFGMYRMFIGGVLIVGVLAYVAYDHWRKNNVGSSY